MGSSESDAPHPWKVRAAAAREAVQRARQETAEITARLSATRRVAERAKHETLSPATLQQLLPHRARTFRARAEGPSAGDREARFAATSAAYNDARALAGPPGDVHRMVMDGLTWWIPHFTHFVDLSRSAPPPRVRAIVELPARLADVERTGEKTDVVVYNAA